MGHVMHEWVSSHVHQSCHRWMSYVTYKWVIAHMKAALSLKSWHTRQWGMAHKWQSHDTHEQIGAQVWESHVSHVSHTNESWCTYERGGSQIWMNHVSHDDTVETSHMNQNTLRNTLQHTATRCNTLPHTWYKADVSHESTHTATHCNTLQHTLQHTAIHYNTLQPTWYKGDVSHKSKRLIPQHCRPLFIEYTSLSMAHRAHIRCNAMHLSSNEAHIHSTHILCPKIRSHQKEQRGMPCKSEKDRCHLSKRAL